MTTSTAQRPPARGRRRALEASVLAPLVVCLLGCLTIDATLKPDGSGSFEMTYRTPPNTTAEAEKRRFSSPHVVIDSLSLVDSSSAALKAHFDDATKVNTAEGFKNVTVTRGREGDDEKLTVTIVNPIPAEVPDQGQPGPKITLHLPGAVREANHDAKVSGDTVTWSFSFSQWMREKSTTLTVRYAAAGAAPEAPKDAPAGAAKDKPATHQTTH